MKKFFLPSLLAIIPLLGVEWDVEKVSNSYQYNDWPVIAVDNQENVGTVYMGGGMDARLIYASNATGSWVEAELSILYGWYSLDYDSKGNAYIVYSNNEVDWDYPMDIYLATDTSGSFETGILVEDTGDLDVPRIKLDAEDNIHFIYVQWGEEWNKLFYGCLDQEGTHTELITDSLGDAWSVDFTFDANNSPHVFFDGPGGLWHAYQSTLSGYPAWTHEKIYQVYDPYYVSATTDDQGYFHLACNPQESSVDYITNKSGMWQGEIVSDTTNEDLWPIYSSIALDPKGNPHIAWVVVDEGLPEPTCEIYLGSKTTEGWNREQVTYSGYNEKCPDERHFFAIDAQGYGHIIYSDWIYGEEDDTGYIYYARTKEPLAEPDAVAERPDAATPLRLVVDRSGVHLTLPKPSLISLNLYDASGRRVEEIARGSYASGQYEIPINSEVLAAGVYFVRLEAENRSAGAKFVVTR